MPLSTNMASFVLFFSFTKTHPLALALLQDFHSAVVAEPCIALFVGCHFLIGLFKPIGDISGS